MTEQLTPVISTVRTGCPGFKSRLGLCFFSLHSAPVYTIFSPPLPVDHHPSVILFKVLVHHSPPHLTSPPPLSLPYVSATSNIGVFRPDCIVCVTVAEAMSQPHHSSPTHSCGDHTVRGCVRPQFSCERGGCYGGLHSKWLRLLHIPIDSSLVSRDPVQQPRGLGYGACVWL